LVAYRDFFSAEAAGYHLFWHKTVLSEEKNISFSFLFSLIIHHVQCFFKFFLLKGCAGIFAVL